MRLLHLFCFTVGTLSCASLVMADLNSAKSFVILSSGSVLLRNRVNVTPVVVTGATSCPGAAGCTMRVGGATVLTGRGTGSVPDLIGGDLIAGATASQGLNCAGLPPGSAAICFGNATTVTGECITGGGGISNTGFCARGADSSGLDSAVATLLPNAAADAAAFSAYLASLPVDQPLSAINVPSAASRTLTFSAGLAVASVPSVVLGSSSTLTISAPAAALVVINVGSLSTPGVVTLNLASSVLLAGGITPDRVVFNVLGGAANQSVQMADNTNFNGTLLAPRQGLITGNGSSTTPMAINGALLFGQSITIGNNVNVRFYPVAQIVTPGRVTFLGTVDTTKLPPPTPGTTVESDFESDTDPNAPFIEDVPGQPGPAVIAAPLSFTNVSPAGAFAAERTARALARPLGPLGPAPASSIFVRSFPALGNVSNRLPPDTIMAVGPNVIVEMVNVAVAIYDRTTGAFKRSFDLAALFKDTPNTGSDPQVVYDAESRNFIAAYMALSHDSSLIHFAVSADADTWNVFSVRTNDTSDTDVCLDFPQLGYSTNKIMLAWNNYRNSRRSPTDAVCSNLPHENFAGAEYVLIDKNSVLTSTNAVSDQIGPDTRHFSIFPVHSLSPTSVQYAAWHPSGLNQNPDQSPQSNFKVMTFTGSGATLNTVEQSFDIGAVSIAPDAHQPSGGNPVISTGGDTRLKSAAWQNDNLWATFNEGCTPGGDTVIRACERVVNVSTRAGTLVQHAQLQRRGEDVYYGAVTLNGNDDVFLGFTVSSGARAPAAAVAAAPRGDLTSINSGVFQDGSVYNLKVNGNFNDRWGDYSGAVPDPVDPRVVWVAQEYGFTDGNWKTAIGRVYFGSPVTITYHQTGACNGFVDSFGGHSAGPNQAYVIFGIESVDNSGGGTTFNFDPDNFILRNTQIHFDSGLQIYSLLRNVAVQPATVVAGQNRTFSPAQQGALVVSTTAANGSVEANQTSYLLNYFLQGQFSDPFVNLVKSFAPGTPPWPNTEDCTTIPLQ